MLKASTFGTNRHCEDAMIRQTPLLSPHVLVLGLAAACSTSHGPGPEGDGSVEIDGGGRTDAGRGDGGRRDAGGALCGTDTCSGVEHCCPGCTPASGSCYLASEPCPDIFCPEPIVRCEDALAIGMSGLPCDFDEGCGSASSCCSSSASCVDGVTRVETTCAPGCGTCSTSADCAPDQFCQFVSTCGGFGGCAPRPTACPRDCPGVCGCDGEFYCNECNANSMGVNARGSPSPDGSCDTPPPPPPDCRVTGCDPGYSCELCFTTYACLPEGAVC
jgi:hypothetical protein